MTATMLWVNDRVSCELAGIDVEGEPTALSAPESPMFKMPGGHHITIAASPVPTNLFSRYCNMMRRNDLLMEELEAQVSTVGLAVGRVRTVAEIAESEWAVDRGAIREVDDRSGGKARVPAPPWIFGQAPLPDAGLPPFQGEHNTEGLTELGMSADEIDAL